MAATAKPQGSHSTPTPLPLPSPSPSLMRERRLEEAMAEYLLGAESGRAPDRGEFLARHPDLAGELASFLDDDEHLRRLAGSMSRAGVEAAGILPGRGAGRISTVADPGDGEPLDPEFRPGGRIGDFELLEPIAVGGMGIVFRARQISLNRIVALKTIRPGSLRPGDDAARRFRIEAEAVARLDHPGIVPIYEMGEHRGWPFLILKLIDGVDLERHGGRLRGEPEAIARLMADVARAVHYAHQRGILHRDLKPSNILLDARGRAHVTDFGLSRSLEADSRMTQTGLILGTPSFMAPEQVAGPRGEVTTAADVYGLGAVLYALLVGRPPFQGETLFETLRQVREQEPASPSLAHPGVDRDLEAICLKCLDKDPRRRYASARAVAADLERRLAGKPIAARAPGRLERARRWYRRNRLIAHLSAGIAALIVGSAAVAGLAALAYSRQAEHAYSSARNERLARLIADARAEDIRNRLVRIAVASGTRLLDQGDTTGALPWFAEALMYDRDVPHAVATHRLRVGILFDQSPSLDALFVHDRPIRWAAIDSTGRRLATASEDGTARVWDLDTGSPIMGPLAHDGPVNHGAFSRDGRRLATAGEDGSVRVWDLEDRRGAADFTSAGCLRIPLGSPARFVAFADADNVVVSACADGSVRALDARQARPLGEPRWLGAPPVGLAASPAGRTVAAVAADGTVLALRAEGGGLASAPATPRHTAARRLAFSPDGSRLATAGEDGLARIWDLATGSPAVPAIAHSGRVVSLAFSPDGRLLATAGGDGTARVWSARTGRPVGSGGGSISHAIGIAEVAFGPDGARLATAGLDGTARVWDIATGAPLSPPLYHGGSVAHALFAADGTRLLTAGSDATARLWNLVDVGVPAVMVEQAGGVHHAVLGRRGMRLATAGEDGTARVWDAETGAPISPPLAHEGPVTRVDFSPDGRRVATAGEDGTARVWDAETGRPVSYPLRHDGPVRDVRFSPDGARLATASADGRARVWDIAVSRVAIPPLEHSGPVVALAFAPDGRWLATASLDGKARVFDAAAGTPVVPPLEHGAPVSSVAFRPDGRALLTACADPGFTELGARQWDLAAGEPLGAPLRHTDGVLCAAYSPDGLRIATASEDRTARVWDAATGEPLTWPMVHQHRVLMAAFSPDGRRLATCSLDGTARVWDAETGEPLSPPLVHGDHTRVGSVAFRPDGRALLTAGMDGTARVWPLPPDERAADAVFLHAQVLSGRKIDETGGEVPLGAHALAEAWSRLRLRGLDPGHPGAPPASRTRVAWHRREAHRLERARQGPAAAWHLERLLEHQPDDPALAARLADARQMTDDGPASGGREPPGR